jgi:Predicted transcriptional regulators
MNQKAVGERIKFARERKNFTQENLAAMANISTTHLSVIERGVKVPKLDTFVSIANSLGISADELLVDVVDHSVLSATNQLTEMMASMPVDDQKKIIDIVRILVKK